MPNTERYCYHLVERDKDDWVACGKLATKIVVSKPGFTWGPDIECEEHADPDYLNVLFGHQGGVIIEDYTFERYRYWCEIKTKESLNA